MTQVCLGMDLKAGPETQEDLLKARKIGLAFIFISFCWNTYIFLKVVSKNITKIH